MRKSLLAIARQNVAIEKRRNLRIKRGTTEPKKVPAGMSGVDAKKTMTLQAACDKCIDVIKQAVGTSTTHAYWQLGRDLIALEGLLTVQAYKAFLSARGMARVEGKKKRKSREYKSEQENRWIYSRARTFFNHLPKSEDRVRKMTMRDAEAWIRDHKQSTPQNRLTVATAVKYLWQTAKRAITSKQFDDAQRAIIRQIERLVIRLRNTDAAAKKALRPKRRSRKAA